MRQLYLLFSCLIIILPHPGNTAWRVAPIHQLQTGTNIYINAPSPGQAVQGSVVILGSTSQDEFSAYEVDFSYAQTPAQGWFLIQESTIPIQDGVLAVWDTTTITDGDYSLRLMVTRIDGTQDEVTVDGLRVRNYTAMETSTPTPVQPTLVPGKPPGSPNPTESPTPMQTSQPPTPTALPTNPVEITTTRMFAAYGKGAAIAIGFFAFLGIYLGIRSIFKKRI